MRPLPDRPFTVNNKNLLVLSSNYWQVDFPNRAGRIKMHRKMMRVPDWVGPEQRQSFVVRLAALYHNPTGSLGTLSEAIGGSRSLLHAALKQGGLTVQTCIKLEELLGREHFPREFFRPDLFLPVE
jgi:hypothetical protein